MEIENLLTQAHKTYIKEIDKLMDEDLPGKHKSKELERIRDACIFDVLKNLDPLATIHTIDLNRKGMKLVMNSEIYKIGIA